MMSWSKPVGAFTLRFVLNSILAIFLFDPTPVWPQSGIGDLSPQVVRERIEASGLSEDEIRKRLRESGYSPNLLDPYLGSSPLTREKASTEEVAALSLLSAITVTPDDPSPRADSVASDTVASSVPELFGLDVFRRATTEFQPLQHGPVPSNYRLGSGDVLVLVLTGDVEMVHTLEITRDGFILIPQVGQIYVNSLTMDQLRSTLYERLEQVYSGINRGRDATTRFDVTVASLRTNQVFVIGEVAKPGAYQLSSVATVLNALYAAGGPTRRGNFRQVELRRKGKAPITLDLYDYLLRGDTEKDIVLEQGDVVFVSVRGTRATVQGAVVRPAIYELKPDETLADLIEAAGGFRPEAALDRILISRIAPSAQRREGDPSRIMIDVPLIAGETVKASPFRIEPGDEVTVFSIPDARRAYVQLRGHVYAPGTFGWRKGLRLSELIRLAGGFRPAMYAGAAHVERLDPSDATRKIFEVRLPDDSTSPYPNDLVLEEFDVVTIYGREEFRAERKVTIAGMVNEPGSYPYREGMTVRDLVLKARGLRDGALLDSAEIAKLPTDRTGGQLAVRVNVPLDSSYLFEPRSSSYRFLPGLPATVKNAPEIPLDPFDHVLIFRQPEFELQRMVSITGEVAFPGTYALRHKGERITDLIERAGGLLSTAYVPGANLERKQDAVGMVDIDLEEIMRRPGRWSDLILLPGDRLHIPEYNPVVRVQGQVNSPTSVQYKPGAGLDYYISNAGGYTRDADKNRVSVRFPNGQAETRSRRLVFFYSSPEPLPGSTVMVPTLSPDDKVNWTSLLGTVAQVAGSVSTIVILLTRLK